VIFLFNKYITFEYMFHVGSDTAYWVILSSILMTCVAWIIVAFLSQPEPEDVLIDFYKRARPMGIWGPIAQKAGFEPLGMIVVFRGLLLACIGAIAVAAAIIAFSAFYISRWQVGVIGVFISFVITILFKKRYQEFMHKLHKHTQTQGSAG